jgi:hypothetical protein
MIQLFDYIGLVFSDKNKEWKKLKNTDKARNFFMLNRFMSIKFPVQASLLSHYKIDPISVSNYWHRTMSSNFTTIPHWIYAKTKKKSVENKKVELPSIEMIKWYCAKNEMSRKDFDENVKFFNDDFLKEIKALEKTLKSQGVI